VVLLGLTNGEKLEKKTVILFNIKGAYQKENRERSDDLTKRLRHNTAKRRKRAGCLP